MCQCTSKILSPSEEVILDEVRRERDRQKRRWGQQDHNVHTWLMILGEEVGEANKAVLENRFLNAPLDDYREELIQVAAVAIAAIQNFDERKKPA